MQDYEKIHNSLSSEQSFRLLKILCYDDDSGAILARLEEFELHKCPPYYALSYTWGKPTNIDIDQHIASYLNIWQSVQEAKRSYAWGKSMEMSVEDQTSSHDDLTNMLLQDEESVSYILAQKTKKSIQHGESSTNSNKLKLWILDEQVLVERFSGDISAAMKTIAESKGSLELYSRTMQINNNLKTYLWGTKNMEQGLRHVLERGKVVDTPDYVWIDAICINQANEVEKAMQIPLMGEIYSNAELVLVWLGDEANKDALEVYVWMHSVFMEALDKYIRGLPDNADPGSNKASRLRHVDPFDSNFWKENLNLEPPNGSWPLTWLFYCEFFEQHRWFSRSWTMQEFCLSRSSVFVAGGNIMNSRNISQLLQLFPPQWITLLNRRGCPCYHLAHLFDLFQINQGRIFDEIHATQSIGSFWNNLVSYLWMSRVRKCQFAQDKVLSVLGISTRHLPPGYQNPFKVESGSTPEHIYMWITKLFLQSSPNLCFLSLVEDKSDRNYASLPTWVPDFSCSGLQISPFSNHDAFNATHVPPIGSLNCIVGERTLSMKAKCFGIISAVYPSFQLYDLLAGAKEIIPKLDSIYHPTGEERMQAFWRTLITDHDVEIFQPHDEMYYGFTAILAAIEAYNRNNRLITDPVEKRNFVMALEKRATELSKHTRCRIELAQNRLLIMAAPHHGDGDTVRQFVEAYEFRHRGICFFHTDNGYIGMCRPGTTPGDLVFLLHGGKVPYTLRKNGDSTYNFIGESYVHGVMQGQLMTPEFKNSFEIIRIT